MRKVLVSDFTIKEIPHGGSEWVNQVLIDNFGLDFEYSKNIRVFEEGVFYIISNVSLMSQNILDTLKGKNYIIIENDYKIHITRHPWRFKDSIIPLNERINYWLYEEAKAVFVQTSDHLKVYKANNVEGNFINLHSSIWSDSDLNLLEKLLGETPIKDDISGVYDTNNWIKNTKGAIEYCDKNNLKYRLIGNKPIRNEFLSSLSKCKQLVFLPIARETFCRLVVEAKCMGVDVITTKNYGASLEHYFDLSGLELISYLREQTKRNLTKIGKYINEME